MSTSAPGTASPFHGWAPLPEFLLADASYDDLQRLKLIAKGARLRLRIKRGRGWVRAMPPRPSDFIRLVALQDNNGALLANARHTLLELDPISDVATSTRILSDVQGAGARVGALDDLIQVHWDLLTTLDPLPIIERLIETYPVRLFRVVPTSIFSHRDFFWRLMSISAESGLKWSEARRDGRLDPSASTVHQGLSPLQSIDLIIGPLVARNQPLAAAFLTARYAHVVAALAPNSGAFVRSQNLGAWPSGSGSKIFSARGEGIYKSSLGKVPPTHSLNILSMCCNGANRLIDHLTDPMAWMSHNGNTIDFLERTIAISTIELGFATLSELGRDWGSGHTFWTAFRALDVLGGLWGQGSTFKIRPLLTPDHIRTHAVAVLEDTDYQTWANDVVTNYEQQLHDMLPGASVSDAIDRVEDLRHLVHGTGAPKSRRRDRLEALRQAARVRLALEDIAVFWWTAVLMRPEAYCIPGGPSF